MALGGTVEGEHVLSIGGTSGRNTARAGVARSHRRSECADMSKHKLMKSSVSLRRSTFLTGCALAVLALGIPKTISPARAQFVCNDPVAGTGGATAGSGTDVACGTGATASGGNSIAVGNKSTATGGSATAVGSGASATAFTSSAYGALSTASGTASSAFGFSSQAVGINAVAIGASASSTGDNSVAIGVGSTDGGVANVVSVGGSAAVGTRRIINVANGTAGTDAVNLDQLNAFDLKIRDPANGYPIVGDKTGNFGAPTAPGTNALAAGYGASATNTTSSAFGTNALSTGNNSVALGAGSTDGGAANVVSVGAPGAQRRITNVAAGTAPTDAANVSQLNNIGLSFPIIGNNTGNFAFPTAAGANALAAGFGATAAGTNAAVFGTNAAGGGANGAAFGFASKASGASSVAVGDSAQATQSGAVAVGQNAASTGTKAIAIGSGATASGSIAVGAAANAANGGAAFGDGAAATGVSNGAAFGTNAVSTGNNSVALGAGSTDGGVANVLSVGEGRRRAPDHQRCARDRGDRCRQFRPAQRLWHELPDRRQQHEQPCLPDGGRQRRAFRGLRRDRRRFEGGRLRNQRRGGRPELPRGRRRRTSSGAESTAIGSAAVASNQNTVAIGRSAGDPGIRNGGGRHLLASGRCRPPSARAPKLRPRAVRRLAKALSSTFRRRRVRPLSGLPRR